jgi:hypothetical protein
MKTTLKLKLNMSQEYLGLFAYPQKPSASPQSRETIPLMIRYLYVILLTGFLLHNWLYCREERAEFRMPQELLWQEGLDLLTVRKLGAVWRLMDGYCADILSPPLVQQLRAGQHDIALVDLIYNECGLALGKEDKIFPVCILTFDL